jgi:hypothetical protein
MESEWLTALITALITITASAQSTRMIGRLKEGGGIGDVFSPEELGKDALFSPAVVGPLIEAGAGEAEWGDAGLKAGIQAASLAAAGGLGALSAPATEGVQVASEVAPVATDAAIIGGEGIVDTALQTIGTGAAEGGGPGLHSFADSGAAIGAESAEIGTAGLQGTVSKLGEVGGGGQFGGGGAGGAFEVVNEVAGGAQAFSDVGSGAPGMASKVGYGALRGGVVGGAKGAATDPDDPLRGFVKGAGAGAFGGGITGLGASMPTRTSLELMSPLETPIEPMSQGLMTEVPDPTMGQMVGQDLLSRTGKMGGQMIGQGIHDAMTPDMGMPPPPGPLAPRPGSPYPNFGALFGPGMQNPMLPPMPQSPFMPFLGRKRGGF